MKASAEPDVPDRHHHQEGRLRLGLHRAALLRAPALVPRPRVRHVHRVSAGRLEVTGNADYVVLGGEFPSVNGRRPAGPGPVREAAQLAARDETDQQHRIHAGSRPQRSRARSRVVLQQRLGPRRRRPSPTTSSAAPARPRSRPFTRSDTSSGSCPWLSHHRHRPDARHIGPLPGPGQRRQTATSSGAPGRPTSPSPRCGRLRRTVSTVRASGATHLLAARRADRDDDAARRGRRTCTVRRPVSPSALAGALLGDERHRRHLGGREHPEDHHRRTSPRRMRRSRSKRGSRPRAPAAGGSSASATARRAPARPATPIGCSTWTTPAG